MPDSAFNDIPQADVFKDQSPAQNDGHVDLDMPNPQPGFRIETLSGWRKAKSLVKLKQQVDAKFAGRSTESDGFIGDERHCHGGAPSSSDHCPWVHDGTQGVVTAFDITNDPKHCDSNKLAHDLIASKDPRIKYVISFRQIASSYAVGSHAPWTWRPYNGSDPHTNHLHISVNSNKEGGSGYDDESSWKAV
jgi:hypothetical protein